MINLPKRVIIQEVVLRDGLQNEKQIVSTDEKLKLVDRLIACGLRKIEITSFVNPHLVPQMADAEDICNRLKQREGITFSALILSEKGLNRAMRCGMSHVGVYVSASETHSRRNSNRSVAEALAEARRLIRKARHAGMNVRAGVMNAFGCAYEGKVPVGKVPELSKALFYPKPDEICLADTSGLGNPLQIKEVLNRVRPVTDDTPLALHLHNTRGLGLANVFSALEEGIFSFDTSLGGLGGCPFIEGATGNIATEDTVSMLHSMGVESGIDLSALIGVSLDFEKVLGRIFPSLISHLYARLEADEP
jgi:hydroxymethylglutaryl-CoA lyase